MAMPQVASAALTESQIQAILGLLQSFGAEQTVVSNVNSSLRGLPTSVAVAEQSFCYTFNNNLNIGSSGSDVANLTTVLSKEGLLEEKNSNFDESVASAVTGFQEKYRDEILTPVGLRHGTGFVGKATRAKLNQLYGCGVVSVSSPTIYPIPVPILPMPIPIPPTTSNFPPVISGVSGPTTLNIGQSGTWTVTASDPENGPLAYSVIWGDETVYPALFGAPSASEPVKQTATFTHTYSSAGVYTAVFYVTDSQNNASKTTISVNVGGAMFQPSIRITSSPAASYDGKVALKIGDKIVITGYPSNLSGDYKRAFFFDPIFNDACGNTEWEITCTAKKEGVSKFYIELYKDGKTYRSNIIEVTVMTATADQGSLYLSWGLVSVSVAQTAELQAFYQPPMPPCPAGDICPLFMPGPYPVAAKWVSSNPSVAKVDYKTNDYKTAAVTGISAGAADIKAYYLLSFGVTLTATAQVNVLSTPGTTVSEQVKCVFNGSTTVQECYSSGSDSSGSSYSYSCKGTESCVVDVKGNKGDQLTWKSSCGGYAYTTMDGVSKYANFSCDISAKPSITVLSPNGGESWQIGSAQTIKWTSSNFPSDRKIDVIRLRDAYGVETNLLTGTINDGSEQIIVPSVSSGNYTLEIKTYSTSGELIFDASDRAFSMITLQQSYPGFIMKTDKSSYTMNETVSLTLSRADGKTTLYAVDLYAVSKNSSQQALMASNLQVGQNTVANIQLGAWPIFAQGGAGDYFLAACSAGCKYGSDSNTNSAYFSIVVASVLAPSSYGLANVFEAVKPLWWPSGF